MRSHLLRYALLSGAILLPLLAADPKREVLYQGDIGPRHITPSFSHGFLAVYGLALVGDGDAVLAYGRDGSLAFRYEPPHGRIAHASFDTDGSAAIALSVPGQPNAHGTISIVDSSGAQIQRIDTGDFVPTSVCFAPDHSLWVLGWKRELPGTEWPDYEVLRHYSREGNELGRHLQRSSFAEHLAVPSCGFSYLRIAGGRIGAVLGKGMLQVEMDMSGKETGRWPLNPDYYVPFVTSDGAAFVHATGEVRMLDRLSGQWKASSTRVPPNGILIGAEGRDLVFLTRFEDRLVWVAR